MSLEFIYIYTPEYIFKKHLFCRTSPIREVIPVAPSLATAAGEEDGVKTAGAAAAAAAAAAVSRLDHSCVSFTTVATVIVDGCAAACLQRLWSRSYVPPQTLA